MLTTSESFDELALTALIASATLLGADVKMGLNTVPVQSSKLLTIGDMTEPTYGSYLRQDVVFGAPFRDPALGIASLAAPITWQETGTPSPTTIVGIFLTFGAGPAFLGYAPLAVPQTLTDLLSAFAVTVEYVQSNGLQGLIVVVN